jgi:short-subunit dehydrogenase involved in D-alanine esterification of teichoic acids
MKDHPDLDSVLYNSGIQRPFDFTKPDSFSMETVMEEMNVNYISMIATFKAFLPYFLPRKEETSLMMSVA